ncbi:MAG: hypothetical protein PHN18_10745 [Sulfurospirillaceae bacterium]|jgi:hypothetical protein|nr:hypothetical protein [Sulfurospirillaceae bacterium]MDD2827381.1 hypothetical protein [Sulfurospirillaceae bacterium]
MSSFDTLFDKMDQFLDGKKNSELSLIFMLLFAIVGFISYSYIYPVTDRVLKQTIRDSKAMEKKLQDEKSYLASVSREGDENFFIKKVKNDIENSKVLLEKTTYTNAYVDNKLKELSYLLFNDENWAKFLNSITQLAHKYAVNIKVIENKINEPSMQKIEQILNLKVDFSGSFAHTMKFINAIEESELVVDVYDLNCTGQKNIAGQVNIAVWGMKY